MVAVMVVVVEGMEGTVMMEGGGGNTPAAGMQGQQNTPIVTDPSVTLACKVGLGLQDLQKWGRRILAERNAEKTEENTWIGWMVAAESIGELDGLIRSCAA